MNGPASRKTALEGRRILLIEDSPEVQRFVGTIARLEHAELSVAGSGEDGLALLDQDCEFDTILLDINLPGISGWEFLSTLRSRPPGWRREPLVLIFTASSGNEIEGRASALGAAGIILKPVSAGDLVQALAAAR